MTLIPYFIKVSDDILFVKLKVPGSHQTYPCQTYRCIHLPTLVITTQLPGGSVDLTENAFAALLPECKMETCTVSSVGSIGEEIYPVPSCHPKHPRYYFIFTRVLEGSKGMDWEIFGVEVDLIIPGPIKIFGRVSRQYAVPCPTILSRESIGDLLLSFPSEHDDTPCSPLSVRFLQVGKLDGWRVVKLQGVNGMNLYSLHVDRDAGYIIAWVGDGWFEEYSFIWWIDDRKPGAVVHLPAKDLASGWVFGRLWSFWNSFIYKK
jgi:hypothetical protein